jgi:hypothetical protein
MNTVEHRTSPSPLGIALLLACWVAGCGSRDPVLGTGDLAVLAPQVTLSSPADGDTGVSVSTPGITATLSEPIAPLTGSASMSVTCAAPCASPTGTTALNAAGTVVTFTPAAGTTLEPLTEYTATVAGALSLATGLVLPTPYVWRFTTGLEPDITRPRVTVTVPATANPGPTTDVPANRAIVAMFTEAMLDSSITDTSFTVTCAGLCVNPVGTVEYVAGSRSATFTAAPPFAPGTTYTARITTAVTDVALNELAGNQAALPAASDYVWTFFTGPTLDTTRPTVKSTAPVTTSPGPTTGVPNNMAISAIFNEDVAPATVNDTSFVVTCTAPCVNPVGAVTYVTSSRTAVFTPAAPLTTGVTYSASLSTAVTDLADNALGGNQAPPPAASTYLWTFTAAAAAPAAAMSVASTKPAPGGSGTCPSAGVNATFTVPSGTRLDPSTVNSSTFIVTGPGETPVNATSVSLDAATGRIATFTPQSALVDGVSYMARIAAGTRGVRDLAVPANSLASDYTWSFTAGPATASCTLAPALASAEPYGIFGGSAGMTNTGINTVINGEIGTIATGTSSITGFHDSAGDIYTESVGADVGAVNGRIYTCTKSTTGPNSTVPSASNCLIATQSRLDAEAAYLELAGTPSIPAPGANLASLTLAPGSYSAPGGSFLIEGGDLTLDAQGDANAVWIFQMAGTLTVGGPGAAAPQSIILAGGAQAKNVFWQVGTAATINAGGGGTMVGTLIAQSGVSFSTAGKTAITTLNGRALSLLASVTLVNTVINVPAP